MFIKLSRSIKCSVTTLYRKNNSVSHETQKVGTGLIINHVQVINCHNSLCDESCIIVLSTQTQRQKTHAGRYTQARIKVCSRNNNDKITQMHTCYKLKCQSHMAGAKAIAAPVFTQKWVTTLTYPKCLDFKTDFYLSHFLSIHETFGSCCSCRCAA